MSKALPAHPNIDWLKKSAKARLQHLRAANPAAKLHQAQRDIANDYGFKSWRALKAHIDAASLDGRTIAAVTAGDEAELGRLLARHPAKLTITGGAWDWPLLHLAAYAGHLGCVEVLIERGYDIHQRDRVDNATALHCAAAGGHLAIVKRLVALGGDIHGEGDDHQMGVLGWATCLRHVHEEVAAYLLSRGAWLTIFSAIALDRADDVAAIVRADATQLQRPMSRNEHGRLPLHHAVHCGRPAMVTLLLELGADPNTPDRTGAAPLAYAGEAAAADEIVAMLMRGGARLDLVGALMLRHYDAAERLLAEDPARLGSDGCDTIALHLAVDRQDHEALRWLLAHGADVNAKRTIYECRQTALHMCAERGLVESARRLLQADADTTILDDKFNADALGWAEYCAQPAVAELIRGHRAVLEHGP
jgi:ankyrin repeat protein